MRSRWVEHNGQKVLYQDFANLFYNVEAIKNELEEVQEIVLDQPPGSLLVISDFTNTEISGDLMGILNQASRATKPHVRKTAVLGVTGIKRTFGDLLSRITGQPLVYFTNEADALEWLTKN
jgi:hypothetical protein